MKRSDYGTDEWRTYHRDYARKNRDQLNARKRETYDPAARRQYVLKSRYHLPWEEYLLLLKQQNGRCGICGTDTPSGKGRQYANWHIDHDHNCCPKTGYSCGRCIRGLLCHQCNTALGNFKDNRQILRSAIDYLDRHAPPIRDS